jgi:hypothetical protein
VPLLKIVRARFLERPLPDAVFELRPDRLSGLRVSARGQAGQNRFVLSLDKGLLAPSFDRPNIAGASGLGAAIEQGKDLLGLGGGTVSLLVPEPSVRVFILTVESLSAAPDEREAFIRWRVGKLMPLMPEDLRLAYDVPSGFHSGKIIVAAAREAVVREYEELFEAAGLRVGAVTVPTLSLANLRGGPGGSGILLNAEADRLIFLAVMDSEWTLYRQKGVGADLEPGRRADTIAQELENTVHFLEDKERKRVERIWVHADDGEEAAGIVARLKGGLPLPVELVDYEAPGDWSDGEKAALAPLMGQIA